MIMDEPTNNLGVPEQQKVLELIRKLRDQGVPVILITHTLPDVFAVSDRLDGHAPRPQGDREADRRDQHRGARAVHGRRARRLHPGLKPYPAAGFSAAPHPGIASTGAVGCAASHASRPPGNQATPV